MGILRISASGAALLVTGFVLVFGKPAQAQQNWQDQNVYQIFTDRFFNGDVSNDNAEGTFNAAASQAVHGGDFKGIEQKLDYIKALGATAIWISPVVLNGNGDYHGYAGRDFYKVAPHLGSLTDLKHLIDAAHAKGLLVIDDIVVNHGALLLNSSDSNYPNFRLSPPYTLFYRDNAKQYPPPFDAGSGQSIGELFHGNGYVQDFSDPTQLELGSYAGLDDFQTETAYVQTQMANIYKFWMDQGFDGFRIDTVKHVDHGFWDAWCPQIRQHAVDIGKPDFFMFGEVADSSESKNGSYTGTENGGTFELDSVLDYPLYYAIKNVFATGTGNTKDLDNHFGAVDSLYDASARSRLVTFVDNHDQPRFLNVSNTRWGYSRLQLALTFLYTGRGIPCLYAGTEQGFNGGNDPNNREDMFAGQFEPDPPSQGDNFDMTRPIFQWVATLNNFRRLYPALRTGSFTSLRNSSSGPGVYAYARRLGNQEVIVAMNTAEVDKTMPARSTTYPVGTVLTNLLATGETATVNSQDQFPGITIPALTVKIFIAQNQAQSLDPLVSAVSPGHDGKYVATTTKIVLQFSNPMRTASVESAFTTTPATTGNFVWTNNNQSLSYQVIGGMPSLTTITVHVGTGATDINGKHLYAPFESRFTTANGGPSDVVAPTITISSPMQNGQVVDYNHGVSGTAADDVNVDNIEERIDDGPWISIVDRNTYSPAKSVDWFARLPFQYLVNGPHSVSMRTTDTSGNISPVASVNVRFFTRPGPYEQWAFAWDATNVGQSDCENDFWQSTPPYDASAMFRQTGSRPFGYIGGTFYNSSNYITNVCYNDQLIYTAERFCSPVESFRYLFHCPPGVYEVTLHEAETYMTGPNQRRFDVYLQGEKKFADVDIFAAAGGANRAVTFTNQTVVTNGPLEVLFRPVYDYARSSAIHVRKIADLYSDTDGIPDWWRLGVFGHATGLDEDLSHAADDPDNDGMSNYQEYVAGTDPRDAGSVLKITAVQQSGTSDVSVSWFGVDGVLYQVQQNGGVDPATWVNVGSPARGFGFSTGRTDYGALSRGTPQFYRVIIVPAQ